MRQPPTLAGLPSPITPAPGNIHDGLITDAIKSAGAAKKGGKAPISAVLDYAEPMPDSGLSLVCTPGNDVEAVTGLVAAGVNVVLFSTGLGTPTGNPDRARDQGGDQYGGGGTAQRPDRF